MWVLGIKLRLEGKHLFTQASSPASTPPFPYHVLIMHDNRLMAFPYM